MKTVNKEKGFTIIELVVVILLLGILTATALPRFMDVTDEAHQAVVDGLEGGLQTGLALFRAQWYAQGQPTTAIADFGNLFANTAGYPVGTDDADFTDATAVSGVDCLDVYNNIMQAGGLPVAASAVFSVTAATMETNIQTAATATTDVVVTANAAANPTGCLFHYVGQYKSGTVAVPRTIQRLTYLVSAGTITEGTYTMNLD